MQINYGLIVIDPIDWEDPDKELYYERDIYHFVGYEQMPDDEDAHALYCELKKDKEFGLMDKIDHLVIISAPQPIIDYYKEIAEGFNDT